MSNKPLNEFIDSLVTPVAVIRQGQSAMDKVFNAIRNNRNDIDRCRILGGIHKKTSIGPNPDFDCVVYYNPQDRQDPFKDIEKYVGDIKAIIERKLNVQAELTPKKSPRVVQFTYKDNEFDVVVTPNLIGTSTKRMQRAKAYRQQGPEMFKIFKMWHSRGEKQLCRINSAAISELSAMFMKKKSAFIHELARLCKFWKNENLKFHILGGSTIIELLAVEAGMKEESDQGVSSKCNRNGFTKSYSYTGRLSYMDAFKNFLQLASNIRNCKIEFNADVLYNRNQIPNDVRKSSYLIDPSNPYHNFLGPLSRTDLNRISHHAELTLKTINEMDVTSNTSPINPNVFKNC